MSPSAASTDFLHCFRKLFGLFRIPNGDGHLAYNQRLRAGEVDLLEAVHQQSHVDIDIALDTSLPKDRPDDLAAKYSKPPPRASLISERVAIIHLANLNCPSRLLSFSRQRFSSPPTANSPAAGLHHPPNVSSSLEGLAIPIVEILVGMWEKPRAPLTPSMTM
jgi:hypothetical protein